MRFRNGRRPATPPSCSHARSGRDLTHITSLIEVIQMKLARVVATAAGVAMLLGALVACASAARLSSSTQSISAHWNRMNFSGGFGTVECEVDLATSMHTSTFTKTSESLVGYVTAANVPRCTRGGATILRETLPWHVTYRSFSGTLPDITGIATNVIGMRFRMREPSIGATCLIISTPTNPAITTYVREPGGRMQPVTIGGIQICEGSIRASGTLSGTASTMSAFTVTLI